MITTMITGIAYATEVASTPDPASSLLGLLMLSFFAICMALHHLYLALGPRRPNKK